MNAVEIEPSAEITEPEPEETGDVEEPETVPEPAPTEPDEPEQVAPAEPAFDPVEMERTLKKVDQAATTYRNRVSALLGDAILGFSPCPLCSDGVMGHLPPLEEAQPASELQARLLDVLKTPTAPEYRPAPHARRCGTCDGWGAVLSGSRLAGNERIKCPTCNGVGYQGSGVPVNGSASAPEIVAFEPPDDQTPLVTGDVDIWQSPRLLDDGQPNPNYGKMPQYKDPTLP